MNRLSLPLFLLLSIPTTWGQEYKVGTKVSPLPVTDLQGRAATLTLQTTGPTVVLFVSTNCPVSNAYNGRMDALYKAYKEKGVQFVFLNANRNESAAEVAEHTRSHGMSYTVYKDAQNQLADKFGASVTPEAFVIDKTGVIVYHGAVDDAQNEARVQKKSLQQALDAVLAGRNVTVAETKAFGCTIKRAGKTS